MKILQGRCPSTAAFEFSIDYCYIKEYFIYGGYSHGGKKFVLVLDDEEIIRRLVKTFLERQGGYVVLEASTAAEARKIVEDHGHKMQTLVIDYTLPDGKGSEVAEELKEKTKATILLMTGYDPSTIETNGFAYIQKPFTLQSFLEAYQNCE